MTRHLPTDEQYEAALTEATQRHHRVLLAAVAAKCQMTINQIDCALGDYLQEAGAWDEIVSKTLAGENAMAKVLEKLIWQQAESLARAELARGEQQRALNIADDRANNASWNRLMAMEAAYG